MAHPDDAKPGPCGRPLRPVERTRLPRLGGVSACLALTAASLLACQAAGPSGEPGATEVPVTVSTTPGTPSGTGPNPCLEGDVPGFAEARKAIAEANLADPASIDEVDGVRFTDAGVAAAGAALSGGATGDALWAATWIAATMGCLEALETQLASDDATIRALAAAAFVAAGRTEGTAVLSALLDDSSIVRGSEPPISIGEFAAQTLDRYDAR